MTPSPQALADEYLKALDECRSEQFYQEFIESNTRLVPREFIQNHGIHFDLVFRKLAFGADYKSDFVYLSKSSDDWNCVLVEIERPDVAFFDGNSNEFSRPFQHALQQINDWKAWFLNAANKAAFIDSQLRFVRTPLFQNPTYLKYVLVYGRRSEYAANDLRRAKIAALESADFKVLSFDSLGEALHTKENLYIAAKRNEYVEILSDTFISETMFGWMPPEQIAISQTLKADALAKRSGWHHIRALSPKTYVMDRALAGVRIRA